MKTRTKNFKIIIPADLEKSKDGDWIIQGLASTVTRDKQGEIILPQGMDLSPIDQKRGIINWDHKSGPENTLGTLTSYQKTPEGLFVKGKLFKNHTKAKAVYEIMSSLDKSDRGRVGMSVEGKILERDNKDGKTIKKCRINAVALTLNPVNQDTYVDLVKSMSDSDIEFDATEDNIPQSDSEDRENNEVPTFTASQVMELMEKALTAGEGYTKAPTDRSGGEALSQEELDKNVKNLNLCKMCKNPSKECTCPPAKLKKMSKDMYKSSMLDILNKIQELYPENSRTELWEAVKDRLNKKFPKISD